MKKKLAIEGGSPAKTTPNLPMFPGGLEIGEEEKKEVLEVLDSKYLFRYYGPVEIQSKVALFEEEFAKRMKVKHVLAVNSCTSALIASLVACGVGPGCEVIIPAYTFFATCAAVLVAKAIPVIAEVDKSLTLDPEDFEKKITPRTKAVIPVHMRGFPCKMDRIMKIAKEHNISVIEDVAQSCGGTYKGKLLGSFGDCNAFSFQYHKIITSGEGGAVATDDDLLFDRAQEQHDTGACWRPDRFGLPRYSGELFPGENYRMSELHGAVLLAQLKKLDGLIARMREHNRRIREGIKDIKGIEFRENPDPEGDTGICLIFYLPDEDIAKKFVEALKAEGIAAGGIYDKGIPDWHIYAHWRQLMDKVTATKEGCPYTCPYYEGPEIKYTEDMCPKTISYLGRAVHMDVPPQLTFEDDEMIIEGIRKVAEAYL